MTMKRYEVTGGRRKLHDEGPQDFSSSQMFILPLEFGRNRKSTFKRKSPMEFMDESFGVGMFRVVGHGPRTYGSLNAEPK
jgi:hypothetical protein